VFNFVKLAELYYAGSHGMDIKGPTARCKHTKANVRNIISHSAASGKISCKTTLLIVITNSVLVVFDRQAEAVLWQPASDFLPVIEEVIFAR
jgi:hypothetical protein